ncbi:MAG TPA: SDR family oxidoreductase [Candidatus Dormibacteraeota bacterium]
MDLQLRGRRAIVTGGSKGLGAAIARELVQEGAAVAICARNAEELEATAAELRKLGGPVTALVADVTKADQVAGFIDQAVAELGGLEVLVNNAGRAHPGNFASLGDEDFQADLEVKLFAQIRCCRAALPHLRRAGGGAIINVNAVYGRQPDPTFFATSVDRAACLAFNKALAIEVAKEKILVNSVNIGFVRTPQWDAIHQRRAPQLSAAEFFAQTAETEVPLGRFGEADEVSGLVAFLASARASYITGASIDISGGMGRYV